MATEKLATWASALSFSSLPESVIDAAIRSFQNSLGCIIGGSSHATVQRAIRALKPTFGHAQCTILGQSSRENSQASPSTLTSTPTQSHSLLLADASNAALINGIASHVHDYDDTHLHTVIHPAGAVVVALLAYSQLLHDQNLKTSTPISGKAFITALVAGIEVGLRIGNAVSPNHYSAGWHITGTVSPIAVAASLTNLLHFSPEQARNALGIAAAQPVGIRVHFGTDAKALSAGRAAANGILAAQLAQGGFTAGPDALEGRRGWIEVLGHGANSVEEQIAQLYALSSSKQTQAQAQPPDAETLIREKTNEQQRWEIEKNTFKPFPCGIVIHPIIDACIQLHNEHHLSENKSTHTNISKLIQSVHLTVHPLVLDLTGKKAPCDGLEAKFSVYHGAAIGLVLGSAAPNEYTDDVVANTDVVAVRERVVAEVDDRMRSDEATVSVTLNMAEGEPLTVVRKHVAHAVGSLAHPMTNEQLREKFMAQVEPVLGREKARQIDEMAWNVLRLDRVVEIAEVAG